MKNLFALSQLVMISCILKFGSGAATKPEYATRVTVGNLKVVKDYDNLSDLCSQNDLDYESIIRYDFFDAIDEGIETELSKQGPTNQLEESVLGEFKQNLTYRLSQLVEYEKTVSHFLVQKNNPTEDMRAVLRTRIKKIINYFDYFIFSNGLKTGNDNQEKGETTSSELDLTVSPNFAPLFVDDEHKIDKNFVRMTLNYLEAYEPADFTTDDKRVINDKQIFKNAFVFLIESTLANLPKLIIIRKMKILRMKELNGLPGSAQGTKKEGPVLEKEIKLSGKGPVGNIVEIFDSFFSFVGKFINTEKVNGYLQKAVLKSSFNIVAESDSLKDFKIEHVFKDPYFAQPDVMELLNLDLLVYGAFTGQAKLSLSKLVKLRREHREAFSMHFLEYLNELDTHMKIFVFDNDCNVTLKNTQSLVCMDEAYAVKTAQYLLYQLSLIVRAKEAQTLREKYNQEKQNSRKTPSTKKMVDGTIKPEDYTDFGAPDIEYEAMGMSTKQVAEKIIDLLMSWNFAYNDSNIDSEAFDVKTTKSVIKINNVYKYKGEIIMLSQEDYHTLKDFKWILVVLLGSYHKSDSFDKTELQMVLANYLYHTSNWEKNETKKNYDLAAAVRVNNSSLSDQITAKFIFDSDQQYWNRIKEMLRIDETGKNTQFKLSVLKIKPSAEIDATIEKKSEKMVERITHIRQIMLEVARMHSEGTDQIRDYFNRNYKEVIEKVMNRFMYVSSSIKIGFFNNIQNKIDDKLFNDKLDVVLKEIHKFAQTEKQTIKVIKAKEGAAQHKELVENIKKKSFYHKIGELDNIQDDLLVEKIDKILKDVKDSDEIISFIFTINILITELRAKNPEILKKTEKIEIKTLIQKNLSISCSPYFNHFLKKLQLRGDTLGEDFKRRLGKWKQAERYNALFQKDFAVFSLLCQESIQLGNGPDQSRRDPNFKIDFTRGGDPDVKYEVMIQEIFSEENFAEFNESFFFMSQFVKVLTKLNGDVLEKGCPYLKSERSDASNKDTFCYEQQEYQTQHFINLYISTIEARVDPTYKKSLSYSRFELSDLIELIRDVKKKAISDDKSYEAYRDALYMVLFLRDVAENRIKSANQNCTGSVDKNDVSLYSEIENDRQRNKEEISMQLIATWRLINKKYVYELCSVLDGQNGCILDSYLYALTAVSGHGVNDNKYLEALFGYLNENYGSQNIKNDPRNREAFYLAISKLVKRSDDDDIYNFVIDMIMVQQQNSYASENMANISEINLFNLTNEDGTWLKNMLGLSHDYFAPLLESIDDDYHKNVTNNMKKLVITEVRLEDDQNFLKSTAEKSNFIDVKGMCTVMLASTRDDNFEQMATFIIKYKTYSFLFMYEMACDNEDLGFYLDKESIKERIEHPGSSQSQARVEQIVKDEQIAQVLHKVVETHDMGVLVQSNFHIVEEMDLFGYNFHVVVSEQSPSLSDLQSDDGYVSDEDTTKPGVNIIRNMKTMEMMKTISSQEINTGDALLDGHESSSKVTQETSPNGSFTETTHNTVHKFNQINSSTKGITLI